MFTTIVWVTRHEHCTLNHFGDRGVIVHLLENFTHRGILPSRQGDRKVIPATRHRPDSGDDLFDLWMHVMCLQIDGSTNRDALQIFNHSPDVIVQAAHID